MTYICPTCRHVFDEPKQWVEPHGEPMSGCPWCYGGGYEDAEPCRCCGEYVAVSELKKQKGYCLECFIDNGL